MEAACQDAYLVLGHLAAARLSLVGCGVEVHNTLYLLCVKKALSTETYSKSPRGLCRSTPCCLLLAQNLSIL